MDPISVMDSVVGLLGAAGKVGSVLLAVKKSIGDAPRLMDQVLSQVKELEVSFSAIQSFLLGLSSAPRERISMIQVDQLVATLTEAVLTFSELEALVTSIAKNSELSMTARLMYVWKEDLIANIVLRLERHKSSLSLMLNIVQCGSDLEAARSRETLENLVQELLRSNRDISRRLRSIEDNFESSSILTTCFRNGTMNEFSEGEAETENDVQLEVGSMKLNLTRSSLVTPNFTEHHSRACFQVDLGTSRVYKRTELYESDVSFTSSAVRTHAWSIFSGLSLSEVSMISAMALPLYLEEISNRKLYISDRRNTNLQVTSHMNGSPPSKSTADVTPGTASDSDSRVQIKADQKLKKPKGALFSLPKRNRGSTDGVLHPKSHVRAIAPNLDAKIGRLAISNPEGSPQIFSRTTGKNNMALYKLVVLGDKDVGRTALTIQLTLQHFVETYEPTIDDSYKKQVVIDGLPCMVEVLDTAGQEEYTALRDQWVRDGEGFVLVYCITKRSSFDRIRRFHNQIIRVKEAIESKAPYPEAPWLMRRTSPSFYPMMLVGNNIHRVTAREVSTQEGLALANELGCDFVETSAKSCINVDNVEKAFYDVVRAIRRQRLQNARVAA